jgi:hypothetical protein
MSNIYGWPDGLVVELVGGPRDGERQRGPHGNALSCGNSHYLPFMVGRPKRAPRYVYRWVPALDPVTFLDELAGLGFFLVDPCGTPGTRP